MLYGARVFVFALFVVLGLSFWAAPIALFSEFRGNRWFEIATFYSHLFLFFPTFGVVALFAFFTPACALVDMYWRFERFGKIRFCFGFLVVAGLAVGVATLLSNSPERSIFEIAPSVLSADKGEPESCNAATGDCLRRPVFDMLGDLRAVATHRIGLSDLTHSCDPDPLIEAPQMVTSSKRYCFVTTRLRPDGTPIQLQTDQACCQAQARFVQSLLAMHRQPDGPSLTGLVHKATLPFKMFFLLMLLVMSIVLLIRHRVLVERYTTVVERIERGIVIGALAMLFFPAMNHAFLQSASLLYGASHASAYRYTAPFYSLGFGGWALLLLLFFYRRRERDMQEFGRIAGVIASAIAIVKYDLIIDYAVRIAGVGADAVTLSLLAILAVLAIILLYLKNVSDVAVAAAIVAIAGTGVARARASSGRDAQVPDTPNE